MTNAEAVNWLINITADIGKAEHSDLWHYEQALSEIREMLEDAHTETHEERTETHACDLIDRQAALDAIDTWDKFGCDPDGRLVRYDDDNHYVPYVHYDDMVHAIKALLSTQPKRWIPCSERLPENGLYLITGKKGSVYPLKIEDGRWYGGIKPVAWMSLPEPYEEQST